jgi:hypothetical protein
MDPKTEHLDIEVNESGFEDIGFDDWHEAANEDEGEE